MTPPLARQISNRTLNRRTTRRVVPLAVPRESLFQQVADRIGVGIVSGSFEIGALIPNESDLGRDLKVSRTAYREAIKFLSAKGLVEARPKSGTRVAARTHWNILDPDLLRWSLQTASSDAFVRDLFELRRFIEPNAARLAAERRTDMQLSMIAKALHGLESREPFSASHIEADVAFHTAIFDASGNAAVSCLKSVVVTTLHWSMRLLHGKTPDAFATAMSDHRRVYEAIANRDGDMAHSVMTTLVLAALADTRAELARRQRDVSTAAE